MIRDGSWPVGIGMSNCKRRDVIDIVHEFGDAGLGQLLRDPPTKETAVLVHSSWRRRAAVFALIQRSCVDTVYIYIGSPSCERYDKPDRACTWWLGELELERERKEE